MGSPRKGRRRTLRRRFQGAFFVLFLVAPALNLLRFDLHETQLWFLGQRWTLGIAAFRAGLQSADATAVQIMLRAFVPAVLLVAGFLAVAWRYGRLYCGWLCPHFSMVETLNNALHRASGRFSLWERASTARSPRERLTWWPVFGLLCLGLGFLWAITLLSYLLPPVEIWGGLLRGDLAPNPTRFLAVGTMVFTLEFALARHLFCRFGCAVGLFQSLAWMANPRGMVVAFEREKARDCRSCTLSTDRGPELGSACDKRCPMRLHPRNIKRMMFSCVQCGRCLDACADSQGARRREPLLQWTVGEDAVRETLRQRREELARKA